MKYNTSQKATPNHPLNRLINPKPRKLPIRLLKSTRMIRHIIRTRTGAIIHLRIILRLRGQLSAQINIRNDTLVPKVRGNVALCAGEVG